MDALRDLAPSLAFPSAPAALVMAQGEAALVKPTRPTKPPAPDLRKVSDATTKAKREVEYVVKLLVHTLELREYNEVLYPAYRQAQKRAARPDDEVDTRPVSDLCTCCCATSKDVSQQVVVWAQTRDRAAAMLAHVVVSIAKLDAIPTDRRCDRTWSWHHHRRRRPVLGSSGPGRVRAARVGGCGRRVSASSDDRDPDAIDDVLHT